MYKYKSNYLKYILSFKRRKSNSDDGESFSRNKIRKFKHQKNELHAPRQLLDLAVTESNKEQEIAYDIAEKLQEEKSDLICKLNFDRYLLFQVSIDKLFSIIIYVKLFQYVSLKLSGLTFVIQFTKRQNKLKQMVEC